MATAGDGPTKADRVKPLCIDLFCGLGGWTEGFLAEGYQVIGFDIERHQYGEHRYPGELVLQDVLTLDGRQFRDAAVIVASPPCQAYSYRAMPWKRAKALPPPSNELFDACFRIAREAGVPLIVENVKGAQPWVGRAKWHYGSFYLWGDVPALMPPARAVKVSGLNWSGSDKPEYVAKAFNDTAIKQQGVKTIGHANIRDGHSHTRHLTNQRESDAVKVSGDWFGSYADMKANGTISPGRLHGKGSHQRKAASALIAKIPFELSSYIARVFKPS